jgi:hypothetical protein
VNAPTPDDEADGMCPNCVTPWKCNGPHELTTAPAPGPGEYRDAYAEVILRHWRTSTSGCRCGQVGLGQSWPEHLADELLHVTAGLIAGRSIGRKEWDRQMADRREALGGRAGRCAHCDRAAASRFVHLCEMAPCAACGARNPDGPVGSDGKPWCGDCYAEGSASEATP